MDYIRNLMFNLSIKTLKYLNLPKSVAVIMDGNRRYAENKKIEKIKGHESGFSKMIEFCDWCIDLNIKELTVFAFSIDNFNGTEKEVTGLMDLFRSKFKRQKEEKSYFMKKNIKINIIGNTSLLDDDIQEILLDLESSTNKNDSLIFNICISYNFTDEKRRIKENLSSISKEELFSIKNKENKPETIYQSLFEENLYLKRNINPDILIRTSGECRLSNFLLYQCRFSELYFISKNWPEVTFYDLIKILFDFSSNYKSRITKLNKLSKENEFNILVN